MRWEHHASSMGEEKNLCRVLVGELAEKRVLERGSDREREREREASDLFLSVSNITERLCEVNKIRA